MAICTDGSYGIEKGLMFSYPIRSTGKSWEIVQGVSLNEFSRSKIALTETELKEEKALVSELIPKQSPPEDLQHLSCDRERCFRFEE